MERKRINASNIRSVGYDAAQQVLEIEFSSGSIVQYSGVSPEVHRRFTGGRLPRGASSRTDRRKFSFQKNTLA
jgi:hypothetical protein